MTRGQGIMQMKNITYISALVLFFIILTVSVSTVYSQGYDEEGKAVAGETGEERISKEDPIYLRVYLEGDSIISTEPLSLKGILNSQNWDKRYKFTIDNLQPGNYSDWITFSSATLVPIARNRNNAGWADWRNTVELRSQKLFSIDYKIRIEIAAQPTVGGLPPEEKTIVKKINTIIGVSQPLVAFVIHRQLKNPIIKTILEIAEKTHQKAKEGLKWPAGFNGVHPGPTMIPGCKILAGNSLQRAWFNKYVSIAAF